MGKSVKAKAAARGSGAASSKKVFSTIGKKPTTLMQKKEEMQEQKPRRKLTAKSTDETVDQIIRDNFKNWGSRVDTYFIDDMNVRLELRRDLRQKRVKKVKMGKVYYQLLKAKYGDRNNAMHKFFASDETEVEDLQGSKLHILIRRILR